MYANINNPANFQLQDFAQFGFRVITTDFIPVPAEQYRTLYVLQDAVVTATTQKGDDITSKAILAGTLMHGLFNSVSITSGRVLAYAAGRVTAEEIIALYEAYVIALGGTIENTQCAIDTLRDTGVDFFADASLVMIPEGYDTGVVYGQRPLTSDSQLTFTRTGDTATRVNAGGTIEKVRTNLLLQSNTFNTTWTVSNASLTSGQSGYDGSNNAWRLNDNANNVSHDVRQVISLSGSFVLSVYAKAGTISYLKLYNGINTAYFNLSTGVAGTGGGVITSVGNGWYRCSITSSGTSTLALIGMTNADNASNYAGDGTGTIYIQNAQLETGDIATDYIPTTTAAVSVGPLANVPRIDYTGGGCGKLLLEPQRTQLFYDSTPRNFTTSSFVNRWVIGANNPAVVNQAVGIFGYNSATKYTKTAGQTTGDFLYYNQAIVVSGSVYTLSGYVKLGTASNAVFVLNDSTAWNSVTGGNFVADAAGGYNEWKRFSITFTAPASNRVNFHIGFHQESGLEAQATGTFFVEGLQLELGSYETSLIPSNGVAVTRGADAAYKTGISSLIGQTEGTVFFEVNDFSYNPQAVLFKITGLFSAQTRTTNQIRFEGTGYDYFYTPTQKNLKIAAAYTASTIVIYINGAQVHEDTSVTISGGSNLFFNESGSGTEILNQALLFKTRLTNAQLAELTTL